MFAIALEQQCVPDVQIHTREHETPLQLPSLGLGQKNYHEGEGDHLRRLGRRLRVLQKHRCLDGLRLHFSRTCVRHQNESLFSSNEVKLEY
jgi:hypothetical protein